MSIADPAKLKTLSPTGFVSFTSVVEKEVAIAKEKIVSSLTALSAENEFYGGLAKLVDDKYFNAEETFVRMMKIRRSSGTLDKTYLSKQAEAQIDAYFASGKSAGDEATLKTLWTYRHADKTGSIRELFELFF
jgi:hypothetical protein